MILNVTYAQVAQTAAALQEHSTGLTNSIKKMKETLTPLYKNWYQSGSPTGDKVHKHEGLIDKAMNVITFQMASSGEVLGDFSKSLQQSDSMMGA